MMPRIVTFSEIRSSLNNEKHLYENVNFSLRKSIYSSKTSYNIFLSHSSKDNEFLPFIINTLENHGGNPYVDIGDNRLPTPPSVETAKILKSNIQTAKRFVLFLTTNSKDSKWVPWELGLSDGAKRNEDIAIFPSTEMTYNTSWMSQEYLGLYRKIVWGRLKGYTEDVWMVWDETNNTADELSRWIRG
jgi:hypothetical protein